MDKPGEKGSQASEGSPITMGMAMAKKMMSQMGAGGSPMEMMQKMMGQMRQGEDKPPMEKMMGMCMGMCAEMLTAIRETNALAVHATPELQSVFVDWLSAIEEKALAALQDGEKDATALGAAIGVSEESARYVLMRLAASGKIAILGRSKV
jgi:hypothetical protein